MNTHVRDNLLETAPAKAATAGYLIRVTGANAIEEADPTDGAKLDWDKIDIDFTPSVYTPSASPAEADDVDDLAAHLKGIDNELNTVTHNRHLTIFPHLVTDTGAIQENAGAHIHAVAQIGSGTGGADGSAHFTFHIPSDFTSLTSAEIRFADTSSVTIRWNVVTDMATSGENPGLTGDSIASTDTATGGADFVDVDVSAAFTGLAANDTVGFEFQREASHANDTGSDSFAVFHLHIEYD